MLTPRLTKKTVEKSSSLAFSSRINALDKPPSIKIWEIAMKKLSNPIKP